MGRTKPQTSVRKLLCLGPRSGLVYPVEDFPDIGLVVVRAPNKQAVAQFIRASMREPGKPGLIYQHGQGAAELLELMRQDFGIEQKPLAAVDAKSGQSGQSGQSEESSPSPKPKAQSPKPFSAPFSKATTPSGV